MEPPDDLRALIEKDRAERVEKASAEIMETLKKYRVRIVPELLISPSGNQFSIRFEVEP